MSDFTTIGRPVYAWSETPRSTTFPTPEELHDWVGRRRVEANRPAIVGNKGERARWTLVGLLVPCVIIWIISCFTAIGPQMHSSCMLHMRSEPYIAGPDGVDLCFGLHGYFDRSTNTTVSKHGYNIMEVARNATNYPNLNMKLGPVTRGFAMTYMWTVIEFFYVAALAANLFPHLRDRHVMSGFGSFLHSGLLFVHIIPVAINLAVFVGVRNTLIQQGKAHPTPGIKVSPVGALAWLQLLTLFVFWGSYAYSIHMDLHEDIFEQRPVELARPSLNRRPAPTADAHAFPYYFHSQAGMDVTSPVTPPSSIYRWNGSVHPRQALGEDMHRYQ